MTMFNFGGYGVQGSDPNLAEKLAKVKSGKKSSKDQVNDFLERELGVDPRELPLHTRAANERVLELLSDASMRAARLTGNSMGLKSVSMTEAGLPSILCPACGSTNGFWFDGPRHDGTCDWDCEDCEVTSTVPTPVSAPTVITENDQHGADWHDWVRVFNSYVQDTVRDGAPKYAFDVEPTYGTESPVSVVPIPVRSVNPDPTSYPSGTVLRIQRRIIREDDTKSYERLYVCVGGPFDDTDITILETMTPMNDLTGWSVIEEL